MEEVSLPVGGENAEEEEAETDFEGRRYEDVEHFGELDVLGWGEYWEKEVHMRGLTIRVTLIPLGVNSFLSLPRVVITMMKAQ